MEYQQWHVVGNLSFKMTFNWFKKQFLDFLPP